MIRSRKGTPAARGRRPRPGLAHGPDARRRPAGDPVCRSGCGACGPGPSCPRHSRTGRARPPFQGSLYALAIDDSRGRTGFTPCLLPHLDIQHVVDAAERAVPVPPVQVLPNRAARREVLRERLPLTPRPEHVEDRVQDLSQVDRSRTPAAFGGPDQRRNQRPLGFREIAVVAQAAPIRCCTMLRVPHEAPRSTQVPPRESQPTPQTQFLSGSALRSYPTPLSWRQHEAPSEYTPALCYLCA